MVVRKILSALIITTMVALILLGGWEIFSNRSVIERFFVSIRQSEHAEPKNKPVAVDGSLLLERFEASQQYEPTPEEIAEDAAFEAEQIAQARQWLTDLDPEQRIVGAEQLSAYPTAEAEKYLVEVLIGDHVGEVKVAAANSLSAIKTPSLKTREALIGSLQDPDEDVRNSAFNTLQLFLSTDSETSDAKKTLSLLKKQLKSKFVPQEMREAIKDYLLDQFAES